MKETAFTFAGSAENQQIGIIHHPDQCTGKVGVLIVVGGPQYRIGAHRQYVHMARHCATQGIPAMRFDYQGIGDSDGQYPGFEHVGGDIHQAIDEFLLRTPDIQSVALWGLCEGASAVLLGGVDHKAVSHIVLANPWVRTESGLAKAYVKHYYLDRLKSPEFWRKTFSGGLNLKSALSEFWSNVRQAFISRDPAKSSAAVPEAAHRPFPDRMLSGLKNFPGQSLLILSEHDLTAREFDDLIGSDKDWKDTIGKKLTRRVDIADTDHTFSTEVWRTKVASCTADWLLSGQ